MPASIAMSRSDVAQPGTVRAAEDHRRARAEPGGVAQLLFQPVIADPEQDEVDRLVQMLERRQARPARRSSRSAG